MVQKKTPTVKPNNVYNNGISPIYWPLFMHNHNENIYNSDEILTIENMIYNQSKSKLNKTDIYDIIFTNGIETTVILKELKQKLKTNDKLIYIKINNSNVSVPVEKDDLSYFVNICQTQNNSYQTSDKIYSKTKPAK